jgi:hypothetical protein
MTRHHRRRAHAPLFDGNGLTAPSNIVGGGSAGWKIPIHIKAQSAPHMAGSIYITSAQRQKAIRGNPRPCRGRLTIPQYTAAVKAIGAKSSIMSIDLGGMVRPYNLMPPQGMLDFRFGCSFIAMSLPGGRRAATDAAAAGNQQMRRGFERHRKGRAHFQAKTAVKLV